MTDDNGCSELWLYTLEFCCAFDVKTYDGYFLVSHLWNYVRTFWHIIFRFGSCPYCRCKIKNAIDGEIEVTLAVSHNVSKLKAIFSHFMTVTWILQRLHWNIFEFHFVLYYTQPKMYATISLTFSEGNFNLRLRTLSTNLIREM